VRLACAVLLAALVSCGGEVNETKKAETTPATAPAPAEVADAVYTDGRIYTVNEAQPWAEAVAIKDGKFVVVGSNADAQAVTGEGTEVADLGGRFVMPGIGDPHIHAGLLMPKRAFCGLPGTFHEPTEQMILDALEACIASYPEDRKWFIAQGFSTPAMSNETLTREVLDRLIPDRPAWIEDESGHNAWFNTKAMEAAGVTADFNDKPEEFFSRTPEGDLAGVAYEGAMNPFLEVLPPFDVEIQKIGFQKLLDDALAKGITMVADGYTFERDLQAWQELKQEGLDQHVVLYLKGNLGTAELTPIETLESWWSGYDLPGYKAVKLGMGGALESISEMLIDGYAETDVEAKEAIPPGADDDAPTGKNARPVIPAEQFANYMRQLDDAGFQVMVHAIGDGTIRATLDGFEAVIKAKGGNRLRHHIDHCSLIHPDDFQRFVDLDVSCTIWPPLNAPVGYNVEGIKPVLKPETWARMYDNRARWDAGIRLVNHSDAPAAVLWPWWGMEASITRGFPGKPEVEKMGPEHALTLDELIQAYTINVAWVLRLDDVTGSIEEGKYADMIVLSHNLFEIPVTDIHKTEVEKTIFRGKVVHRSD
jgi:predicted amidohydrolase YtcJ